MASAPSSQVSAAVQAFAAAHYAESGAERFGIDVAGLVALLADVLAQRGNSDDAEAALETMRLEELVLARKCVEGHEGAWEIFLTRYRSAMYDAAYKIARDETSARSLADSLYAELYGLSKGGEVRASKLRYYLGRGSLAGWLRTVVAQEYVNQYRKTKRETSLEAAIEDGQQFAVDNSETPLLDSRVEAATAAELAMISSEERFLLAAYFLNHRTLLELSKVLGVHESTVSRKLERVTVSLRKRIRKRLIEAGMSSRQAEEAMQDVDVRDLQVKVRESLGQDRARLPFYKEEG